MYRGVLGYENVVHRLAKASLKGGFYMAIERVNGPAELFKLFDLGRLGSSTLGDTTYYVQTVHAIIKKVVQGLWFLYNAQDLSHLDLKPENVLVDGVDNVKTMEVRLTDFGLSTRASERFSHVHGTPMYIAPEVFKGNCEKPEKVRRDVQTRGFHPLNHLLH